MSLFRSKKTAAVQPDFSGLAIQTATAAAPIPFSYGVTRLAPNIIWQNGVAAVPQYSSSGGGKGGGGKTVSGYEYYCWVMYAIGEGPVRSIGTIYNGQGTYPYGSYGLSLLTGTTPQTPWGPALANPIFAPAALNYNGTAYMASSDFDLGSSASVPSLAFEVYGLLQATTQSVNAYDADPAVCVQDFLTNPQYGVGFPPTSLNAATLLGSSGDASYQSYCKAIGLAFSPALTDQETANSVLARWLQLTNTAAIWSGGQLKFVPYGDAAVTAAAVATEAVFTVPALLDSFLHVAPTQTIAVAASALFVADGGVTYASTGTAFTVVSGLPTKGQYAVAAGVYTFAAADANAPVTIAYTASPPGAFTPNIAPVYALTDDDFIAADAEDPVQVARLDPYAVANVQRLECFDRANQYAATPIEARDQNAIEQFGLRIGSTITAHEFCDLGIGLVAAQLILQRGLYIRQSYSFKLSWECCLLEPMDIVSLTDAGLGLLATPVRITAIEEDGDGLLAVTAEEFPGGTATAGATQAPVNTATTLNRNAAPAPINPPVIVEPPSQLTGGSPQLWVAVSGGANDVADPNWGGANVWVSRDGTTFTQVGQVTAPARQGVIVAGLPAFAGANPDTIDTLAVDLGESGGALSSGTPTDAANGVTLAVVDHELVAYTTAALTGAHRYALTGLQRGLYGSQPLAHAPGASFARLDGAVFKYTLPAGTLGATLTLKFQSFNIYGGAVQDLSTCVPYLVTPVGSGLFGPTAQEIATGTSFDEGLASQALTQTDDYGKASDAYTSPLDDGLASDLATSLAIASGGTGATTPAAARANIGAAAAGSNADITSLTGLSGIGIGTALDPNNPFAVKAATALFDNAGAGVAIALDKASLGASAYHQFETAYSARAQVGLLGSDRYRVSVSLAGSSFTQAFDVDPATGHVGLAGYTADANNALGVIGTACLFTAATDSMRFAFNKVAAANDALLSFQTNFSPRALLGTTGSDQFQLKVSPDGSTFFQVFVADQATGNAAFKALLGLMPCAVASLPSAAFNGALAFASNGRKVGEAAGSGTGVVAAYSNGAWRRLSDDSVVAS